MAKKNTSKKQINLSTNQKVGIGVGLTTAAVAAAGTYFLYGSKNAAKNRGKVKSWMLSAKAEVLHALEQAEEMTEKEFNQLIETVGKTYSSLKDASKADIADFKREMKQHWPQIVKEGKSLTKTVAKVVSKKPATKTVEVKKTSDKKTASKKPAAKSAGVKKAASKKPAAKKPATKKSTTKKSE